MYSGLCTVLDFPTGRPLLSGRHRTSSYKRSIAALELSCEYTDALREDMADVLSWMDQAHELNPDENWRLALNVQFLINKEMGGTPRNERCNAVLVKDDAGYRIDVTVGNTTVIKGERRNRAERAIVGLRRKVDEMVYGKREDYLGLGV